MNINIISLTFFSYVAIGLLNYHRMQQSISVLKQLAIVCLTSSTQLPGQYDTPEYQGYQTFNL